MKIDETGYVTHNTVLLRLVIKFKLNSGKMNASGKGNNMGQGQGTGRGGGSQGSGESQGSGRGRNKGDAFGTGRYCVCTKCGEKVTHQRGVKCTTLKCPECGNTMIREEMIKSKN